MKQPKSCPHGHPPIDIDTLPQHAARDDEGKKAFLHRFVVAGAAIRWRAIHRGEVEVIIALDAALTRM